MWTALGMDGVKRARSENGKVVYDYLGTLPAYLTYFRRKRSRRDKHGPLYSTLHAIPPSVVPSFNSSKHTFQVTGKVIISWQRVNPKRMQRS